MILIVTQQEKTTARKSILFKVRSPVFTNEKNTFVQIKNAKQGQSHLDYPCWKEQTADFYIHLNR